MPSIDPNAWAGAQKAAAVSILGDEAPPVLGVGSQFYNRNRWTARILFGKIAEGIKLGNGLTEWMVTNAVQAANSVQVWDKKIVVAALSDADRNVKRGNKKPKRVRLAGVYHETWHTKYSCTRDLTFEEVWGPLQERWNLIPDPEKNWPKLVGQVLHWGNLIEDIRIERRGCEDHPGARSVMPDLQDFILRQEGVGVSVSEHRSKMIGPMQVIAGTFRDLGLGYKSNLQKSALERYKAADKAAWDLVTKDALRPLMDRSINMTADDDLGHWWAAMEVVAILFNLIQQQPEPQQGEPQQQPEPQQGEPQESQEQQGDPQESQEQQGDPQEQPKNRVFKVGDRAKIKTGIHAGREVEVVSAGIPHPETGVQDLEFRLVEPD